MLQVLAIVIILVLSFWAEYVQEEAKKAQKEKLEKKLAEERFAKALTQTGVTNLFAFGDFRGSVESGEENCGGLEAELVQRELAKWEALNAGRLINAALVGSGTVTTRFSDDGVVSLDFSTGSGLPVDFKLISDSEPFTAKDFQLAQPNPETAVLRYKVESGWKKGSATTVWARRDGRWATVSYQVVSL
jgi:hypothetical protein